MENAQGDHRSARDHAAKLPVGRAPEVGDRREVVSQEPEEEERSSVRVRAPETEKSFGAWIGTGGKFTPRGPKCVRVSLRYDLAVQSSPAVICLGQNLLREARMGLKDV